MICAYRQFAKSAGLKTGHYKDDRASVVCSGRPSGRFFFSERSNG